MKIVSLVEAYQLSKAKEFRKIWNPETNKELFGGKYRIYIPYTGNFEKPNTNFSGEIPPSIQTYYDIDVLIHQIGEFRISDYGNGYAKKEGDNRIFKIGSIISKFIEKNKKSSPFSVAYLKNVLQKFNNDPARQGYKAGLEICISRHPYDVGGMSTNRGWNSCMNAFSGMYRDVLEHDIKEGTLVAYLISKKDKNIKNPLARIAIKPFIAHYGKSIIFKPETKAYGIYTADFYADVKRWCNSINSYISSEYYSMPSKLYNDSHLSNFWTDKHGSPGEES